MRLSLSALLLIVGAVLPAAGQPLRLQPAFDGQASLGRFDEISFTLNRPLSPEDGSLAVFLGPTDLTALFEAAGTTLRYVPHLLPLPSGEGELTVYLVAGDDWQELGRYPIRVRLPGGFEQAKVNPGLTLSNEGQLAESTVPAPEPTPDHRLYQDFSGQLDLQAAVEHPAWMFSGRGQVVGVSYQNEALRFGTLQDEAPRVDLAAYQLELRRGRWSLQAGHLNHGRHRHLINSFSGRGATAGISRGGRLDFTVAALSGSRIVGWDNVTGLAEPDHRIVSSTVGFDLLEERPGGLRLEGTYLDGSVLPVSGFNGQGVLDAQTSRGGGLRLLAASEGQRFRVEAGYAGSRFSNPYDPALAQGSTLVPVDETTRFAHYLEASLGLLRDVAVAAHLPLNVSAAYRRERVDPLYQTVAAFVQADRLHDTFELQGSLGGAGVQVVHRRSEDNLGDVPSILKTKTRQSTLSVGVPVRALLRAGQSPALALLPVLSYSFNQTHQFGAGLPVGGGFSASHVPDQMNRIHAAGISWQGARWSLGYRFNDAFQDNRQEGRAEADFLNQSNSFSLSYNPSTRLSVGVDASLDRTDNRGQERVDRTTRLGVRSTVRPWEPLTLSATLGSTRSRDDAGTSRSTNMNYIVEAAYAFELAGRLRWPVRGQVFVRYARQASTYADARFALDTESRTWTVNTGLSLTLF